MRLKKGFTLAEILIVLMVIGVIATMTIPSMMKGVTEAQLKAGYKKAYNTIANFAAMERVAGNLPQKAAAEDIALLYQSLNSSLSVKEFAQQKINAMSPLQNTGVHANCMKATINGGSTTIGIDEGECIDSGDSFTDASAGGIITGSSDIWIITEDNIAYTLTLGGGTEEKNGCATKQGISAKENDAEASKVSCAIVVVDVNGLSKGPNKLETQGLGAAAAAGEGGEAQAQGIAAASSLETLTGDQYKIYLGSDGATAGPRIATVSGRIMADLK